MARRALLTLFLITRQRVYRADFARPGQAPDVTVRERPDSPDLPAVLDAVLDDGPAPGRTAFMLSSDFWIQTLGQPANRVHGLNEADIASALNFEAEVLSGLPAFEATAAAAALPPSGGERRYLLLQVRTSDRDRAAQLLRSRGSRLGGLLHPAGVPGGLEGEEFGPRIELWPDAAVSVRPAEKGIDAAVSNADPVTERWKTELGDASGAKLWIGPGVAPPPGAGHVRLENLETLTRWFGAWAAVLMLRRRPTSVVPVVAVPRPPTPARTKVALTVALTMLVAAAALLHWRNYSRQMAEAQQRVERANARTKQIADLEARVKTRGQERDKAQEEASRLERLAKQVKNQQERYARLLEVLAEKKPAEVMIQKIETEHGEPKLVGLALRSDLADEFVRDLTPAVQALGWEVRPSHKTAKAMVADGSPWSFEIGFRAAGDLAPPPPPDQKPGGRKR